MSEFSWRRFLILLVSVLGGLVLLFTYLPVITGCVVVSGFGFLISRAGITGLRKGFVSINARTKFVTYERSNDPIEFWFYVVFSILIGISVCCFALFLFMKSLKA